MGLLTKIRSERPEPAEPAGTAAAVVEPVQIRAVAAPETEIAATPTLPPAVPCLICECPAIWISVYDAAEARELSFSGPDAPSMSTILADRWKCCDCDPPPAWSLVGARLLLVGDPDLAGEQWEVFGRCPAPSSRGPAPRPRGTSPTALADFTDPTDPYRGPQPSLTRWEAFAGGGRTSRSNRPGRVTPQPPAQILAAPPIRCPRCQRGRVLRELRVITGGVCWGCHLNPKNEIDEL